MGGIGSTRWRYHDRKTTVEECLSLSIRELFRYPVPQSKLSQLEWTDRRTGNVLAVLFYLLDASDLGNQKIWTSVNRWVDGKMRSEEQWIGLEWTQCNRYGGVRRWFCCPAPYGTCGNRRCGKLYLRPNGLLLSCRKCHDLTYSSCQESNNNAWLRRMIRNRSASLNQAIVE